MQKLCGLPFKSCQHKARARVGGCAFTLCSSMSQLRVLLGRADHDVRRTAITQRRHPGLRVRGLAGACPRKPSGSHFTALGAVRKRLSRVLLRTELTATHVRDIALA